MTHLYFVYFVYFFNRRLLISYFRLIREPSVTTNLIQ
jgi:hypothetical protein